MVFMQDGIKQVPLNPAALQYAEVAPLALFLFVRFFPELHSAPMDTNTVRYHMLEAELCAIAHWANELDPAQANEVRVKAIQKLMTPDRSQPTQQPKQRDLGLGALKDTFLDDALDERTQNMTEKEYVRPK